jgi:hypothetical protein
MGKENRTITARLTSAYYVSVLFIMAALALWDLDKRTLWSDEAQVVFFAKNLVTNGKTTGWDGWNLFTERNGSLLHNDFSPRNPPLDFLVCATAFKLLGISTFSGRLFFVLIGIACGILFMRLLHEQFGLRSLTAMYAFPMLCLSTQFILYIRQCRYYSPAVFLTVLALFFFWRVFRHPVTASKAPDFCKKRASMANLGGLTVSLAGLFFASPLLWAAMIFSLTVLAFAHYRGAVHRLMTWQLPAAAVFLSALILPYALSAKVWERPDMGPAFNLRDKFALLFYQLRDMDENTFFPILFFILFVIVSRISSLKKLLPNRTNEVFILIFCYIPAITLLSREEAQWKGIAGGHADIRYLVALLPLFAIAAGALFSVIHRISKWWVAAALPFICICTNIPSVQSFSGNFGLPTQSLIIEHMTGFKSPIDEAVDYLDKNIPQNQLIYVVPDYYATNMVLYCGDRYRIASTLDRTTSLDVSALTRRGCRLFIDQLHPDIIISFTMVPETLNKLSGLKSDSVFYVRKAVLPTPGVDGNRPELMYHRFWQASKVEKERDAIWIFEPKKLNRLTPEEILFCVKTHQLN